MPIGVPELLIILVIVLLLFGARRLPEVARGLGTGMREFKDAVTGKDSDKEASETPALEPARAEAPVPAPAAEKPATESPEAERVEASDRRA
jgi:sec-independent protein translocase protein TatA